MTDTDFPVTIFHNPACGTSRNTLAMIQASGETPTVVEYLSQGWTRPQLEALLDEMGKKPRDILRISGTPAEELGLTDAATRDETILEAMIVHPILVNRPIVRTPKGTRLCRPSELVFGLLRQPPERFEKEDGEVVGPPL
ncbi:arsenate reductase (glutaredoxin) [Caulobacter sp. 73W]|uniref:Arsenate reductase n=1 Tax=Caulobacter sp. 73W TaxID=3161137 RepID=A0AB39KQ23_9CAUL